MHHEVGTSQSDTTAYVEGGVVQPHRQVTNSEVARLGPPAANHITTEGQIGFRIDFLHLMIDFDRVLPILLVHVARNSLTSILYRGASE